MTRRNFIAEAKLKLPEWLLIAAAVAILALDYFEVGV